MLHAPRPRDARRQVRGPATILIIAGTVAVVIAVYALLTAPAADPRNERASASVTLLPGREAATELEPTWRVTGFGQGQDGLPLTRVGGVAIGDAGETYVAQPLDRRIVRLDANGSLLWQAGGPGEGPGEFSAISAIGMFEDTLFVSDADQQRVSLFSTDGRLLATRELAARLDMQSIGERLFLSGGWPVALLADGHAIAEPHVMGMPEPPRAGVSRGHSRIPLMRIDSRGSVMDTVAWRETIGAVVGIERDGALFQIPAPFQGRSLTAVMPGGRGVIVVRWTDPDEARVTLTRLDADGDTARHRTYGYEPRPLTQRAVEQVLSELSVFAGADREVPNALEFEPVLRGEALIPEVSPPITGLAIGQDGSVWLRREEVGEDAVAWTVLDSIGEVRDVVLLPRRQRVATAAADFFIAVGDDPYDLPSLLRYDRSSRR